MTTGKKVIIGVVLVFVLLGYYGYSKAQKLIAIFQQMTMEPKNVGNFKVSLSSIDFTLDVMLTNPTVDSFDINSFGIASVKSIDIYYKKIYIATSSVNITSISVPAKDQLIIYDIPVSVPPKLFVTNPALVYELATNFDLNQVITHAVIEIAGVQINI